MTMRYNQIFNVVYNRTHVMYKSKCWSIFLVGKCFYLFILKSVVVFCSSLFSHVCRFIIQFFYEKVCVYVVSVYLIVRDINTCVVFSILCDGKLLSSSTSMSMHIPTLHIFLFFCCSNREPTEYHQRWLVFHFHLFISVIYPIQCLLIMLLRFRCL